MTNLQLLFIGAGIIIGVVGSLGFGFPYLKKKGVDPKKILDTAEQGLEEAGTIIKVGKTFVPSKALDILDIVDNLALRATKSVQQLAITSQLPLDQRKVQAKESILAGLKAFNIPVSSDLEKIVDDAIQRFVFDSKTPDEQKSQQQNTLQQQIATLQAQLTQTTNNNTTLSQENAQLKQKLANVQSAANVQATTIQQAQ